MPYSPTTWVDDDTPLSAANLNNIETGVDDATTTAEAATAAAAAAQADVDAITAASGVWTAYTPVLTASSVNPNIGADALAFGRYTRLGNVVHYRGGLAFSGAGIAAGTGGYRLSLPVSAATGGAASDYAIIQGVIEVWDGANLWRATPYVGAATFLNMTYVTAEGAAGLQVGAAAPFTWASGDGMWWNLSYEAA